MSRLLTTSALAAPIVRGAGIKGAATLRAGESAAETLNQRSADDLMFGREQAVQMGRAAEHLGLVEDGTELTRRLIEGEDVDAQVMVGIAGFLPDPYLPLQPLAWAADSLHHGHQCSRGSVEFAGSKRRQSDPPKRCRQKWCRGG